MQAWFICHIPFLVVECSNRKWPLHFPLLIVSTKTICIKAEQKNINWLRLEGLLTYELRKPKPSGRKKVACWYHNFCFHHNNLAFHVYISLGRAWATPWGLHCEDVCMSVDRANLNTEAWMVKPLFYGCVWWTQSCTSDVTQWDWSTHRPETENLEPS